MLSEYGIARRHDAGAHQRVLRENGLIAVREELGLELLDPGASAAFAVADHQVAHVYVNDRRELHEVRDALEATPGVERGARRDGKQAAHVDHPRAGDLVAIAAPEAWFTYYYWLDDERAPDFARTVDIHRKPGYDPVELFLDPAISHADAHGRLEARQAKARLPHAARRHPARRHARERLARATGARGSDEGPVFLTKQTHLLPGGPIDSSAVYGLLLSAPGSD